MLEDDQPMDIDLEELPDNLWLDDADMEMNYDQTSHKLNLINEKDYSLNSPIITDECSEFIKFSKNLPFRDSWNLKSWARALEFFRSKDISFMEENQRDFSKIFAMLMLKKCENRSSFSDFLFDVEKDHSETLPIVKEYLSKVFKIRLKEEDIHMKYPEQMFTYGEWFWISHWITLLMNSKTNKERECLRTTINSFQDMGVEIHKENFVLSTSFGCFYGGPTFVYSSRLKALFHQLQVLMLKDTSVARLNTILYLARKWETNPESYDLVNILNFYQEGDRAMALMGIEWYDAVALIEPTCNLRFTETSHEIRPKILLDDSFKLHVQNEQGSIISKWPITNQFFQHLNRTTSLEELLTYYGSFRHWGHPEINYLDGLEKLYQQVNLPKDIDGVYAEKLASDLAFMVLKSQFTKNNKWFLDTSLISEDHPLHENIKNNTFPTISEINALGDTWHKLPIIKCFEIPDMIDPSIIYSDKSHSIQLSEIIAHVASGSRKKIPSRRVLSTFLSRPATNWPEFLQEVNDKGLSREDLVIGLKAKEREIKVKGRFFALMSWKLREYFVITEYLIKQHFVPLFSGLTMADDFATVTKKMLDRTSGHGDEKYEHICYANHIDYQKWNNHQRASGTNPVFRVMGQFLGYPNLICRTHEFFENSLIYYNNRPDLMWTDGTDIYNKSDSRVCWRGQLGGLEGLRQKGWSINNLLVINREGKAHNTEISVLAQGDNQVICSHYKARRYKDEDELTIILHDIYHNNRSIMQAIKRGTDKLGLIINEDETIQGSEYLNYGKVPIWRGNICSLTTKRWSRVCCVTNDQLPSMANIMATVITNALTIANFSPSPIPSILGLNFFGALVRRISELHNPALRDYVCFESKELHREFKVLSIYLDPSLGGTSGASLNRFLIRGFPDPVTESLTFWNILANIKDDTWYRKLARKVLKVEVSSFSSQDLGKLTENPMSLNIRHGVSYESTMKEEVKKNLLLRLHTFQNRIVSQVLSSYEVDKADLSMFLLGIKPRFPRLLSEIKACSYVGIMDSFIGIFQKSRTIRSLFKDNYFNEIDSLILKSELSSLRALTRISYRDDSNINYHCMSSYADALREASWGGTVVGTTIPHPTEFFSTFTSINVNCPICLNETDPCYVQTRLRENDPALWFNKKGPYPAYLGSSTSENTSILMPWEQESQIPIIHKAQRLRRIIGWMTETQSNLSKSVLEILKSLTGEKWESIHGSFKRTGSALHRFGAERQGSGGYNAISPTKLTRLYSTTDYLGPLQSVNLDLMFQSILLYCQATAGEHFIGKEEFVVHHHLSCRDCIRPIPEITIESEMIFYPNDQSSVISQWKPESTPWLVVKPRIELPTLNWESLSSQKMAYLAGVTQAFSFGHLRLQSHELFEKNSLFPLILGRKVIPRYNLLGIFDGLYRSSCLHCLQRKVLYHNKRPKLLLGSLIMSAIDYLSSFPPFIAYVDGSNWSKELKTIPHSTPTSYPASAKDSSLLIKNYFLHLCLKNVVRRNEFSPYTRELVIFADVNSSDLTIPLIISEKCIHLLCKNTLSSEQLTRLRSFSDLLTLHNTNQLASSSPALISNNVFEIEREVRHALRHVNIENTMEIVEDNIPEYHWDEELVRGVTKIPLTFSTDLINYELPYYRIKFSPLMSASRQLQLATGAHYKMRDILTDLGVVPDVFFCLGDGSGGLTALCLRMFPGSKGIFNSLLELEKSVFVGQKEEYPSAITELGSQADRVLNLESLSRSPSDLRFQRTWTYLRGCKECYGIGCDLVIVDCEADDTIIEEIERQLLINITGLVDKNGVLIYKTHLSKLGKFKTLSELGSIFKLVDIYQSESSSHFTDEIYIVCQIHHDYPTKLYCDPNSILPFITSLKCYQSDEAEFRRAQISSSTWLKGIPRELIPDRYIQLGHSLTKLQISPGNAHCLEPLTRRNGLTFETIFSFYLFLSSSLIRERYGPDGEPLPPSDNMCRNQLILSYALHYFIAKIRNDLELFTYLNEQMIRKTPFNWGAKRGVHQWSLFKNLDVQKAFYIDKSRSLVTEILRGLLRFDEVGYTFNELCINENLTSLGVKRKCTDFDRNSGCFDLIHKEILRSRVTAISYSIMPGEARRGYQMDRN